MQSRRLLNVIDWIIALGALAAIVFAYRKLIHANPTTVALTLLLYILLLAAHFKLRHAVVVSVAATACWNFYFLPPVGTFTVSDPQNWLALFAFLATSVIGSRLSQQAREETARARIREREIALLFTLSRELLQTESVAEVVGDLPGMVYRISGSTSVWLYLLEGDRLYQAGLHGPSGGELPRLRQLALGLPDVELTGAAVVHIPLREGVRPQGLLTLTDLQLSTDTCRAIGGLVSTALNRARVLETIARTEANRESERMRTLVLDSITHELRTPLTAIKGAASTLLSLPEIDLENRHELLCIVDEEADRLNRLIGQAVEMAQLEAQDVHMNFHPVLLEELFEATRGTCAWVFTSHPVEVSVSALPAVFADPEMLQKVLCNLLENAAKYSPEQSPVIVSAERKGDQILVSIADRGIGIDPGEQAFIFDRLYRAPASSQNTSGSGMGLAISRAIVEAHAGTLAVTSQPGHGSVFTFSLPVAKSFSQPPELSAEHTPKHTPPA